MKFLASLSSILRLPHQSLVLLIALILLTSLTYLGFSENLSLGRYYIHPQPQVLAAAIGQTVPPKKSIKIPILLYHYVENIQDPKDTIRRSLDIPPGIFESQIKTLTQADYTFLTPNQIPDFLAGKQRLPKKPIILSFDDGYRDFYIDVWPILKKYQIKAVAYIVPGFINKPNNLTSGELEEVGKSDLVEIGGHTMDHLNLKGLPEVKAKYQIDQGKKILEDIIQKKIVSFAYPYGAFDNQSERLVKQDGFTTAVTTISGETITSDNLFTLYRIRPGRLVGQSLLNYLNEVR